HDVTNLIDIALEMPFIKGEQVYLVGFSRGGMMAYRACQEAGEKIRACSINSGLADSYIMYDRGPDMARVYHELVGGGPDELPEEFDRRSATRFADQIDVPLLIGQGTADVRVIPKQAYDMADALKAAGKVEGEDYKLVIFDGAQHGLANTTFMREQLQWFEKFPLED
ncbi:MAG: prolyl oligopeptidase family serine peptidase, partial [Firmicutes bacterium]|nr:prolyl oligopeptidase family serine peptidase [Bacillota bacterium]